MSMTHRPGSEEWYGSMADGKGGGRSDVSHLGSKSSSPLPPPQATVDPRPAPAAANPHDVRPSPDAPQINEVPGQEHVREAQAAEPVIHPSIDPWTEADRAYDAYHDAHPGGYAGPVGQCGECGAGERELHGLHPGERGAP